MEPHKLRRWRWNSSPDSVEFFTCARPGRSKGKSGLVPDYIVDAWVRALPGDNSTVIVSLLGRKHGPKGDSEFSFYPFHGGWDRPAERHGRPSFQEWLEHRHTERSIQILEHPIYDFCRIPPKTLDAVASKISPLLSAGRTVVLMDSGGETRTRQVCKHMGFIEDTRTL
jgi:hypothetical protein